MEKDDFYFFYNNLLTLAKKDPAGCEEGFAVLNA